MKRALSGIRCSGVIHIGNYLGAVREWVAKQDEFENIYFLADLHAITTPIDPKELKENVYRSLAIYMACGLDPKKSILFLQSQMHEHTELAWILNCYTKIGDLTKMTQLKHKSGVIIDDFDKVLLRAKGKLKNKKLIEKSNNSSQEKLAHIVHESVLDASAEVFNSFKEKFNNIGVGLLDYPVLMAADILLYQADVVPVGEDQVQHVELTRDLAKRFNHKFGETFKIPEVKIKKETARIMGLDNPEKKMSKSAESQYNYIALLDEPDVIRKKISRAVTDSERDIKLNPERKGLYNLMGIYHALSGLDAKEIEKKYEGKGYKEFKEDLGNLIVEHLEPIQKKYHELIADKSKLDEVLVDGHKRAKEISRKTLSNVKNKVGFIS